MLDLVFHRKSFQDC